MQNIFLGDNLSLELTPAHSTSIDVIYALIWNMRVLVCQLWKESQGIGWGKSSFFLEWEGEVYLIDSKWNQITWYFELIKKPWSKREKLIRASNRVMIKKENTKLN